MELTESPKFTRSRARNRSASDDALSDDDDDDARDTLPLIAGCGSGDAGVVVSTPSALQASGMKGQINNNAAGRTTSASRSLKDELLPRTSPRQEAKDEYNEHINTSNSDGNVGAGGGGSGSGGGGGGGGSGGDWRGLKRQNSHAAEGVTHDEESQRAVQSALRAFCAAVILIVAVVCTVIIVIAVWPADYSRGLRHLRN